MPSARRRLCLADSSGDWHYLMPSTSAVSREEHSPLPVGSIVDKNGRPIDPTANVIALNEAAVKRSDDLREAQDKLTQAQIESIKEMVALRASHTKDMAIIRAEHTKEIRQLDSDRLKSIREVDVLAGDTAARRADEAIRTLATTTAINAETLRALVASTAATLAGQLDQKLASVGATISGLEKTLTDRTASLEKSSYTGAGKEGIRDPMMIDLIQKIDNLAASRNVATGETKGGSMVWGFVAAAVGLLIGIGGFVSAVVTLILKVIPQ